MKTKKLNAELVWKQMEDLLAPRMSFSTSDRVVYSYLFRHSRLEGKLRFQFSISWLARGTGLSRMGAREALRRLISRGVLRLLERNSVAHHVVQVRLPDEIRGVCTAKVAAPKPAGAPSEANLEEMDFWQTRPLRRAIHTREGGCCFYCLRHTPRNRRCLDHVVPQANLGSNSYRNLVSCCLDCNSNKAERPAVEFVRSLYRDRRLSSDELSGRLRALDDLAAGKLIPPLPAKES